MRTRGPSLLWYSVESISSPLCTPGEAEILTVPVSISLECLADPAEKGEKKPSRPSLSPHKPPFTSTIRTRSSRQMSNRDCEHPLGIPNCCSAWVSWGSWCSRIVNIHVAPSSSSPPHPSPSLGKGCPSCRYTEVTNERHVRERKAPHCPSGGYGSANQPRRRGNRHQGFKSQAQTVEVNSSQVAP